MKQRQSPRAPKGKQVENPQIAEARRKEDERRAAFDRDLATRSAELRANLDVEDSSKKESDKEKKGLELWQNFYSGVRLKGRAEIIKAKLNALAVASLESQARVKQYEAQKRQIGAEYHIEAARRSHFAVYISAMELAFKNLQMKPEEFQALEEKARSVIQEVKASQEKKDAPPVVTIEGNVLSLNVAGLVWQHQVPVTEKVKADEAEEETPLPDTTEANVYALVHAMLCDELARRSINVQRDLRAQARQLYRQSLRLRGIDPKDLEDEPTAAKPTTKPKDETAIKIPITVVDRPKGAPPADGAIAAE